MKLFPPPVRGVLSWVDRHSKALLFQPNSTAGETSASMDFAEQVLQQNSAVVWNPAAAASSDIGARSLIGMQTTCAMYAPLSWQNERLGVLCVDTRRAGSTFSSDDLRLFIAIAHPLALSIYSQRLTRD